MCLHNVIVDYRDKDYVGSKVSGGCNSIEIYTERRLFEENCDANTINSIVRGQDIEFTSGRRPINDKEYRLKCLSLRDELQLKLLDYGMHCPRKMIDMKIITCILLETSKLKQYALSNDCIQILILNL